MFQQRRNRLRVACDEDQLGLVSRDDDVQLVRDLGGVALPGVLDPTRSAGQARK